MKRSLAHNRAKPSLQSRCQARSFRIPLGCCIVLLLILGGSARTDAQRQADEQAHEGRRHAHDKENGKNNHIGAQDPRVTVKATIDKDRILIGQPIQLMLEATVPAGSALTWPALDSLPHFEWMEKGKVDSSIRTGEIYYRQYLTVTSFDSGAWAIPRLPFLVNPGATAGARPAAYFSDSARIVVSFSKFDASKDYHDIKDIIDVPNPFAKWIGWIIAGVTLLAIGLVIWLVRKKKKWKTGVQQVKAAPRLSPYEEAIRNLEALEKEGITANGTIKVYYTRLNDIFRVFVLRRLGIASLSETNDELIGQIRRLPLNKETLPDLAETLQMTDFVKFAKFQPGVTDSIRHLEVIKSSINLLNALGTPADSKDDQKSGSPVDLNNPQNVKK